jgi:hypothetical protein
MRDLKRVKILAKATANLQNTPQIIYKTYCNGVKIYKFSHNWKGKAIEIVRPDRQDTSKGILRNNEYSKSKPTEPLGAKSKKREVRENLE